MRDRNRRRVVCGRHSIRVVAKRRPLTGAVQGAVLESGEMERTAATPRTATGLARLLGPGSALVLGLLAIVGWTRPPAAQDWPTYAMVFEEVAPSVVNVHLDGATARLGTGFAVAPTRVVTARHLIAGVERVEVRDVHGRSWPARVVGTDARVDLALLELEGGQLQPVRLGTSDGLRVGDTVAAVGNPYGLGHTLSVGVVGHRGRRLSSESTAGPRVEFLQLSIPLNPGNSGGPVFDAQGRVVGVMTGTHAIAQAIAFAVPVEVLHAALPLLTAGARVSRAFLGVRTEADGEGERVIAVIPSSPADRAGIRAGDALSAIDGERLDEPGELDTVLDRLEAERVVSVRLLREGQLHVVDVVLSDWAEQPIVVSGMTLRPVPGSGGEVVAVRPRSRAERAGVAVGDLVRSVNGGPVYAPAEVKHALLGPVGRMELVREGALVVVELAE